MQDFLELIFQAYKKLSGDNIQLLLLVIKVFLCAIGGLIITVSHSFFSYQWLRNNFNLYVGIALPIIGLVITTVIGTNIALSIGMLGALSIVRFRAAIKEPGELVYLFLIIAAGIGCGSGQIKITVVGILFSLFAIILSKKILNSGEIVDQENYNILITLENNNTPDLESWPSALTTVSYTHLRAHET